MKKIVGLIVAILLLFSFRIILIGFGLLVAAFIHAGAQHNNELVIKGCEISIQNGASLVVQGDFRIMNSGALLRNDGLLETQGNMYSD